MIIVHVLQNGSQGPAGAAGAVGPTGPTGPGGAVLGPAVPLTGLDNVIQVVPPGTRRIKLYFDFLDCISGTLSLRLGTSAGLETSGYSGSTHRIVTAIIAATLSLRFVGVAAFSEPLHGIAELTLVDPSTNRWACVWHIGGVISGAPVEFFLTGFKTLVGSLTQIEIATTGGLNFQTGNYAAEMS